jgi:hypothetical protein
VKNITITLAEDVARWSRLWAAEHDISVSRMLGDLLRAQRDAELGYARAMSAYLERAPRRLRTGGRYPPREALHDRAALC